MQDAIEMGISLPNTENFSPFFENIKFGHQNILLRESNWRNDSINKRRGVEDRLLFISNKDNKSKGGVIISEND